MQELAARDTNALPCNIFKYQTVNCFVTFFYFWRTQKRSIEPLLFLPRDAMRKHGLCCRPMPVRLSACPCGRLSVTFVHSIETTEDIVKLLCRPGSPIILVFLAQAPIPNSKGNPFGGGVKYKGWENLRIFD